MLTSFDEERNEDKTVWKFKCKRDHYFLIKWVCMCERVSTRQQHGINKTNKKKLELVLTESDIFI